MAAVNVGEIVMCFGRVSKCGYELTKFCDRFVSMARLILDGRKRQTRLKLKLWRRIRGQGLTQIIDRGEVLLLRLEDLAEAERRRPELGSILSAAWNCSAAASRSPRD